MRPWLSRSDYLENNRQNLSSHLDLDILENSWFFAWCLSKQYIKNQLFMEITSATWQAEKNRLLFSKTGIGIDDQDLGKS